MYVPPALSANPQPRDRSFAIAERKRLDEAGLLRCAACPYGPTLPPELHHVIPLEMGGPDTADNMLPLCLHHHARAHRLIVARVEEALQRDRLPDLLSALDAPEEDEPMAGHIRWTRIRRSSPEQAARFRREAAEDLEGVTLKELRALAGATQVQVAEKLEAAQTQVAQIERRDDHKVSTLKRYVEALGGELHVHASLGDRLIKLKGV